MFNKTLLVIAGGALILSVAGCGESKDGRPVIGDQGAGATKPGRPGGGTRSTANSGIPAHNLDPTSGVSVASRGTTGSVAIYNPAPAKAEAAH